MCPHIRMAAIKKCWGPLLKTMAKLPSSQCRVDRLCFRGAANIPRRVQSIPKSMRNASGSDITVLNVRELNVKDPDSQDYRFFCKGETTPVHDLLEQCPSFQETVFSRETFKKFIHFENTAKVVELSTDDPFSASLTDLIDLFLSQSIILGGQDFIGTFDLIEGCLPSCNDSELLGVVRAVCFVSEARGSEAVRIFWNIIDRQLLSRFSTNFSDPELLKYYLKVLDLMFWTQYLHCSTFFPKLVTALHGKDLVPLLKWSIHHSHPVNIIIVSSYPSGVQLLFYIGSVTNVNEDARINIAQLTPLIKWIPSQCPFDVLVVAVESFTMIIYGSLRTGYKLPHSLYDHLLSMACKNVNHDNVLIAVSKLLLACPSRHVSETQFHELLDKISERDASVSPLVLFYIFQAMAKSAMHFDSYYVAMENFLLIDGIDPSIHHDILKTMYGNFGPSGIRQYAVKANMSDLFGNKPFKSLQKFCMYCDSGINAFQLWEEVIQAPDVVGRGDVLKLKMLADDLIAVHAPEYKGPRLDNKMRQSIYDSLRFSSEATKHSVYFPDFVQWIRNVTNRNCQVTDIVPALTCPGVGDAVICSDHNGKILPCNINYRSMKPWNLKTIPSSHLKCNQRFFAVWIMRNSWTPFDLMLKRRLLEKLGYISITVDFEMSRSLSRRSSWLIDLLKNL